MSDIKITVKGDEGGLQIKVNSKDSANGSDEIVKEAIGKITQIQNDAERAVKELASYMSKSMFTKTRWLGRL